MKNRTITTLALTSILVGCRSQDDYYAQAAAGLGEFGLARQSIRERLKEEPRGSVEKPDRDFALERMRLGIATLADGYTPTIAAPLDEVFEILRRANVNGGRRAFAALAGEDRKIWKGEPFEQALALHYVGLHHAQLGSWDNARTAFLNTLFPLASIAPGERVTPTEALIRSGSHDETFFDRAVRVDSDFALGHLMSAFAASQMGREDGDENRHHEALEHLVQALALRPELAPVADALIEGTYNAVLVVDAGKGPWKIATGPDGAVAEFRPLSPSDEAPLVVSVDGVTSRWPVACDLNAMAVDHTWTSLEDLRLAKSWLGDIVEVSGEIVATEAAERGDVETALRGLGATTIGLLIQETARADTRYCELMPQRVYVVPLTLERPDAVVTLSVAGRPATAIALPWDHATDGASAELRYVRLIGDDTAPGWATSGQVLYANPFAPEAGLRPWPYVLGGDCVRPPSAEALSRYQRAGHLRDWTLGDLEAAYRAEGVVWDERQTGGDPGVHVLEGGRSLICPHPGTAGYARLFGRPHPSFVPREARHAALAAELAAATETRIVQSR